MSGGRLRSSLQAEVQEKIGKQGKSELRRKSSRKQTGQVEDLELLTKEKWKADMATVG